MYKMNMEIVKTFNNVDFNIKKEADEIWFWGGEVAKVLVYARPGKAIADHVDEDGKRKVQKPISTSGVLVSNYKYMAWQINEYGLYELIFNSK